MHLLIKPHINKLTTDLNRLKQLSRHSDSATGCTVQGWNPGRSKKMSLFSKSPDRLWGPPSLLSNWYRCYFPGVKRPRRDVDHAPPSSTEVKNEWSYTSTPPTCLHDAHRGTFTFTCTILKPNSYYSLCTINRSVFLTQSHRTCLRQTQQRNIISISFTFSVLHN